MDLEDLKATRDAEYRITVLTPQEPTLYSDVAELLDHLEGLADEMQRKHPDSLMTVGAKANYRQARILWSQLRYARMRKLTGIAVQLATGYRDEDPLTDSERDRLAASPYSIGEQELVGEMITTIQDHMEKVWGCRTCL